MRPSLAHETGCARRRVQFADGTIDDWDVTDMTATTGTAHKSKRGKAARRQQQPKRESLHGLAKMSTSELFSAGSAALNGGAFDDALAIFEQAVKTVDPKDVQTALNLWYNHGLTLRSLGRFEEAVPHFRKVVAAAPGYVEAHHHICAALFEDYQSGRQRDTNMLADTKSEIATLELAVASCNDALEKGDADRAEGRKEAYCKLTCSPVLACEL